MNHRVVRLQVLQEGRDHALVLLTHRLAGALSRQGAKRHRDPHAPMLRPNLPGDQGGVPNQAGPPAPPRGERVERPRRDLDVVLLQVHVSHPVARTPLFVPAPDLVLRLNLAPRHNVPSSITVPPPTGTRLPILADSV